MQYVSCYDIEAKRIEELCDKYDLTEPELIEILVTAVDDGIITID